MDDGGGVVGSSAVWRVYSGNVCVAKIRYRESPLKHVSAMHYIFWSLSLMECGTHQNSTEGALRPHRNLWVVYTELLYSGTDRRRRYANLSWDCPSAVKICRHSNEINEKISIYLPGSETVLNSTSCFNRVANKLWRTQIHCLQKSRVFASGYGTVYQAYRRQSLSKTCLTNKQDYYCHTCNTGVMSYYLSPLFL